MKEIKKLIYTGVWFVIDVVLTMSIMFVICEDDSIDWIEWTYFGFISLCSIIQGYNFCHTYHKND